MVVYKRFQYKALTQNIFGVNFGKVVAYRRWSHVDVRLYTSSPASVSAEQLKSLLSTRERRTVLKLLGTTSTIVHLAL